MNSRRLGYVDFIRGRRTESRGFAFANSVLTADKWDFALEASSLNCAPVGYLRNSESFVLASGEILFFFVISERGPVVLYYVPYSFHHFVFPSYLCDNYMLQLYHMSLVRVHITHNYVLRTQYISYTHISISHTVFHKWVLQD